MRLEDLLTEELIAVPLEAGDLEEALGELLGLLRGTGALDEDAARRIATGAVGGEVGEVVRVNDDVLLVLARSDAVEHLSAVLGISRTPLLVPGGEGAEGVARAVLLLLTPHRLSTLRVQAVPTLTRILRDEERTRRLLLSSSTLEVRSFRELMEAELHERLLVEDALDSVSYRVYPDTPLDEVLDLMVRRGIHAVPVVGEKYEVLGIISAGDILKHLLPRKRSGDRPPPGRVEKPIEARDVMTRTVMCVSAEQSLIEAANMMMNKDVEQLPVVREGEFVGFLTRESLLRVLFSR